MSRAASASLPAPFRFAHVSDPHLTTLDGVAAHRLRDKRFLGWLSWRRRRRHLHRAEVLAALVEDVHRAGVDHVVVTGDLTHVGLPSELEAARDWLAALGPPERVTVIPGNHDLYVPDAAATMQRLWAPWMQGDAGDGFPSLRLRGPLALIGLDSARPSPPLLATGGLGAAQIDALAGLLRRTRASGHVRVVLVHHAPLPGVDRWRKRLVDAPALARVLAREGAELVLHGHGHRFLVNTLDGAAGRVPVVAAPSASMAEGDATRRAAWNLCELVPGPGPPGIRVQPRRVDDLQPRAPHWIPLAR